jgi:hypothetical protein
MIICKLHACLVLIAKRVALGVFAQAFARHGELGAFQTHVAFIAIGVSRMLASFSFLER